MNMDDKIFSYLSKTSKPYMELDRTENFLNASYAWTLLRELSFAVTTQQRTVLFV